jgi:two-component system, NtrC family, response regulator AtoC
MQEKTFRIYIVEDDDWFNEFLLFVLSLNPDNDVRAFKKGKDAIKALGDQPHIVTLDYHLPDMDGGTLLKKIKTQCPQTECIIISQQDKIDTAIGLLKDGAYDYFVKSPDIRDRLLNTVDKIKQQQVLQNKITLLEEAVGKKYSFENHLIGKSENFLKIFPLIQKATETLITVSISGETGTGKEEVAKAIHYNSPRKSGPFIAVNMAAVPRELAESELFGHEKGAFTGAMNTRVGRFEESNGGTLFLDEIGEMDLQLQAKLLRVIQEKEAARLGSNKPVKFDSRIIVATHKNLQEEVKKGNFREDLFFRLFGLQVKIPALRERTTDIVLLAEFFIKNFCNENSTALKTISAAAKHKLMAYHFPGNVRELKSVVELACVMCDSKSIEADDLNFANADFTNELLAEELTFEQYEKKIIYHFLKKYNNNAVLVAEKLGIGKSTIYRFLNREKP